MYTLLDNQYLGQVMETGLVGLAALLTLFLVGIFCARGARRRARDEDTHSLGQALFASIAVPMVTFATFDGFGFSMIATLTFVVLGATACLWRLTVDQEGYTIHGRWAVPDPLPETVSTLRSRDGDPT
jgi:O-antigen ligase